MAISRWWSAIRSAAGILLILMAVKGTLLEVELRRRLFEHVRKYPGLHLREISRALDVNANHAKYHLQRLEKGGLVSSQHEDGYWRFWPKEESHVGYHDKFTREDKNILAVLRRPVPLHVTLLLLDLEEATHGELLPQVEVSHSTLHYHLSKMEQGGILQSHKTSRERKYRLVDPARIRHLLIEYRPPGALVRRFLDAWEQVEPSAVVRAPSDPEDAKGGPRSSGRVGFHVRAGGSSSGAGVDQGDVESDGDTTKEDP